MADDVPITAGIGTVIATDEISTRHFQKVKLVWGADGSANDVSFGFPVIPGYPLLQALTWAAISCASSGANSLVAAGGGSTIVRVYAILLTVASTVTATFLDSTPTNFTGAMTFSLGGGIVLPPIGEPWFKCAANKAFQVSLGTAVQCSGMIGYTVA